ncbi:hypothetical protein JT27_15785 [Alcaligenes faecalis]|jgi:hypothetical protein|uniref:hypothetical protein n=1 Tax=Alcaligenes faecalis TaxID=511 RepID=UPI00052D46BF|nr:hypothetical protein [Alcaligenes faecalis]KGP00574.1 hypothetical protein JT27_15785 [Alcaligenes faecalis]
MHKLWRGLGLAIGFTVVTGSVSAQTDITPASEADIAGIRVAMEKELKDASSARFADVIMIPGEESTSTFCGNVNSKNSYGAYEGYTPFMGMRFFRDDGKHIYFIVGISSSSRKVCELEVRKFKARQ